MITSSIVSVEKWLADLPPEIQIITESLRSMARKHMPDAHEFIYHDAIGYSTSASPADRICYIAPQKKGYVNFGFFFGAELPDPTHLLIGEGKRLRHVKIQSVEAAKNPALENLVIATWQEASASIANMHDGLKKSKTNLST